MLRSLLMLAVYLSFLGLGAQAPFIATLGYVWVDTFQPQYIAYILLNQIPVAMIMGLAAFGSYFLMDRRHAPPPSTITIMMACLVVWVTMTLIWAQAPEAAWTKWDWAFKTLLFSTFIPFAIRSRVQIEAFVQVYVFSLAANFVPFGVKTLISGGGYGMNLGLVSGNAGLAEGGQLSTICLMMVPLCVFLSANARLTPQWKIVRLGYLGIAGLAIVTAIGTYERSALIGLAALGAFMWVQSKNKFMMTLACLAVAAGIAFATGEKFLQRMSTIGSYQSESSAAHRVLVWKWTLEFVATHPLGGGFDSYRINHIEIPASDGHPATIAFAKAFHSSYFEMLGEHGYPGFVLFIAITIGTMSKLRKVVKWSRSHPDVKWTGDLASAVISGMTVFLTSGAFVGLAFQPMFWYFVALGVSIYAYMLRVQKGVTASAGGWRGLAAERAQVPAPQRASGGIPGQVAASRRRGNIQVPAGPLTR